MSVPKKPSGPLIVSKDPNSDRLQMNFPQGKPTKVVLNQDAVDHLVKLLPVSKEGILNGKNAYQRRNY